MKQNQITIVLRSKLSILNSSIVQVTVKINFRVLLEKFWAIILPYIGNLWKALLTRYSRTDNWGIFRYFWYFRKEKKTELSCGKSERTIFTDYSYFLILSIEIIFIFCLFVCLFVWKDHYSRKYITEKRFFRERKSFPFEGVGGYKFRNMHT